MMESSTDLMPTGSSMMPRVQAPSHGAGQTRPVNSGKLLVFIRRVQASFQRPWLASAFHSGMRLPSGQPERCVECWWQKGVPQSMQRAACVRISCSSFSARISWKSSTRSAFSRFGNSARSRVRKPRWLFTTLSTSSTFFGREPRASIAPRSSMSLPTARAIAGAALICIDRERVGRSACCPGTGKNSSMEPSGEGLPSSRARSTAFRKSDGKMRVNSAALSGHLWRMRSATALPVNCRWDSNNCCRSFSSSG
mmetsp:Transcript_104009/g.299405  ORF Transcript_104009/g.299405 Transcript_104009/m.299405 type:complete len:253 (-) Transcript_104009:120-878(-)